MARELPTPRLAECRVLVTATSFGAQDPSLKARLEAAVGHVAYNPSGRPLKAAELLELLPEVDGVIAGLDEFARPVIEAAGRLRVLARYGVGVDRVDLDAASECGVQVTNTPGANSAAVAELTLALLLALARRLCAAEAATRRGEWPRLNGLGLRGKIVGLVGLGAVGREVSLRLKSFGCRVLAFDPFVTPERAASVGAELVSLDELLPLADFISLHAQVTAATRNLVNAGFLERLKPGAYLINTARGELIDEAALLAVLRSGKLAGAGLDCFCREPLEANHPLLDLPQVIATPHMGAHTDEAVNKMGQMALEDCLAVLSGRKPAYPVNEIESSA